MTIALELKQLKNLSRRGSGAAGIDLQVEAGILCLLGRGRKIHDHRHHQLAGEQNLWSGQCLWLRSGERRRQCQAPAWPQEFNFNPFETVQQIVVNRAGYYGVERKEALSRSESI